MQKLAWTLACSLFLSASNPAAAQTAEYLSCVGKADELAVLHNTAYLSCIATELKVQDAALNKAYRAVISKMTPEQKNKAVAAQRAWIQFRDSDCSLEVALEIPLSPALCIMSKTKDRATELSELDESWVSVSMAPASDSSKPTTAYHKKNGMVEVGASKGGAFSFEISSVAGQNTCSLGGDAAMVDANRAAYTSNNPADQCVAVFTLSEKSLKVMTKDCESRCGLNAAGSMDGIYKIR